MKNNNLFTKIVWLILLCVVCIITTVGVTLLAGAINITLFDFRKLNFANMIPVLLIGVFVSCVVVGIAILFVGKDIFLKVKNYLNENNKNNGGNKS